MLYAARVTRPDIAYAVQALSRHLQSCGPKHWEAAKRVLRYLKGTRELGLKFSASGNINPVLVGYSDADWGGDPTTWRSTTAYLFQLAGGAISWASKLQNTVALSTAEAEYMALCSAVQEAVYLRRLLADLGFEQQEGTIIHEDNQSCIAMAENPVFHARSKHIAMRYHFTREKVASGEVRIKYLATQHQLADLLTKALERVRLVILRKGALGH